MTKINDTQSNKNLGDSLIYADLNELRRLQFKTRGFSFMPNQPANSLLSGKHVSKLRGRGLNFEELRHYCPGDDIRAMDWKVTQRTGKPHVKVYTEEKERNVYLAIDQRMSMFFGSSHKMKSVIAAELAALMAWRVVETGDRVGAIIYNDDEVKVVPAKRGRNHVVTLLAEIIKKNHQLNLSKSYFSSSNNNNEDGKSFNKMLEKLRMISGHNALVILIGDGHGWNDQSTDHIKKIRQHSEIIACHVFDPLELDLPKMTQMVVSDGNKQIQFSSLDKNTQQKYQTEIARQLKVYDDTAKKYRIPLLSIDTLTPVDSQVRKAFGAR
ncbi:DUF58 domain-containing protein [Candidatus Colwellia aromaticivorans]|uniref:DUF58 domain-containing protein n=1 Tax=Candidatus Colwellia aromaticivorans TaxID=2267621 RepID=UPI000DF260E0|nr:DUF58 domain-containing protein [Candidatus Colwellia aromaticivorans]